MVGHSSDGPGLTGKAVDLGAVGSSEPFAEGGVVEGAGGDTRGVGQRADAAEAVEVVVAVAFWSITDEAEELISGADIERVEAPGADVGDILISCDAARPKGDRHPRRGYRADPEEVGEIESGSAGHRRHHHGGLGMGPVVGELG